MSPIKSFRDAVLRHKDPAKILKLADQYIQQSEELGSSFILPREYAVLAPALNYYTGDLKGWTKFVKGVRELLPARSKEQRDVQAVYRTLLIRLTQQQRRVRLDAAVGAAVAKQLITNAYEQRVRYAKRCTQHWLKRRMLLLKEHRRQTAKNRLSTEEREQLLEEFWVNIDREIANGELPKP